MRRSWLRSRALAAVAFALAASMWAPSMALAQQGAAPASPVERRAILLPAIVVKPHGVKTQAPDPQLADLATTVDAAMSDAAQDLGLVVDLTHHGEASRESDADLTQSAQTTGAVVIAPTLERRSASEIEIRIAFAQAGSRVLRVRTEHATPEDVAVRTVVMLRDLVNDAPGASSPTAPAPAPAAPRPLATPARSAGRATLAVNATLYGGLVGFSIERSAGSDDPRLLYPLLAVGAGIGLGSSIIVAEEWDVGVGDAWYLSAGAWWPTIAGHLLYEGRFRENEATSDARWTFGLVGGVTGITLATLGLSLHGMGDGGAMLAHSGGGLGLVFGGLAEFASRGDVRSTPFTGMGYGAGLGWLAASAVATQVEVKPGRVLAVDLGAFLGGLGGAALASPLLFDTDPRKERGWVSATAGASLLGMGIAWYVTRDAPPSTSLDLRLRSSFAEAGWPSLGLIGESVIGSVRAPIVGLSWGGILK